jgi:O-antigen/teichoic acid export membrane protein
MNLGTALHSLQRWRPGHYLRSSGGLFFWLAIRAGIQVLLILGLTRLLSASEYGSFVAALAVATLFTPLAGLGIYSVLVRDGARDIDRLPDMLGAALSLWWRAALVFGLLGFVTAKLVLPAVTATLPLAVLVFSEITSTSLTELIARKEQARHRTQRYGAINAGLALSRLGMLVLCALGHVSLQGWMWSYAFASLGYAGALLAWTMYTMPPCTTTKRDWQLLREGRPFLLAILSLRVQSEVNKPIIAHTGLAAVGNFNIAQRALDIAALPLNALQEVLAPRLFASRHPVRHALLPLSLIMGLAALEGLTIWYAAPLLPHLFGPGYDNITWLIRAMVLIPAVQALRGVFGVVIVALNRASVLTGSYIVSMVASIGLNLWLVPWQGLHGAVIAAYTTEALTAIMLAAILVHHHVAQRRSRL